MSNTAEAIKNVIPLNQKNLEHLPAEVFKPRYDRRKISTGILHMSVGGFHRAHQAVYLDDLFSKHGSSQWGICGVGLLANDLQMAEALAPQDWLYTVVERSGESQRAQVIGSLKEFIYAPNNRRALIGRLASDDIRIATLTITEGGYCYDQGSGELDCSLPAIAHDLADPHQPISGIAILAEALDQRRVMGKKPFTVLSCDNLQGNGDVARKMVVAFAELRDAGLARWIEQNVAFPNCMVDRITPATTDKERRSLAEHFGVDDAWPVVTESFRQWVVEDHFCNGRPDWELVGVQMTGDVRPYEKIKIRLLNAGHSAMGYLGYLAGYRYIHEIIADRNFREFITGFMDDEVSPLLEPVPGIDLNVYKRTLIQRFGNEAIGDKASRICLDGSSKMPKFILPSIRDQLARGGSITRLTLVVAAWFRYLAAVDEQGSAITIEDPMAEKLMRCAQAGGKDPRPLLSLTELFGNLHENPRFVTELSRALEALYSDGAEKTLATCLYETRKIIN